MTAQEVKKMHIQDVVNDPQWQIVRKSLIGNWKHDHRKNVKTLREYWSKGISDPLRVRRILNVLVGSVHRVGITKGQKETDQLRKEIRIYWKALLDEKYDANDPKYKTGEI